uniref:CBS domain-containing protein n=1 Tax=Timema poppense TaxID=170557 RepID=A0A7R9DW63_TIMPO|nr:unnamed protein product [Timema poppensis]
MVTMGNLMSRLINTKALPTDCVEKVLYRQFRKIKLDTNLGRLSRILDKDHFVLVVHSQRLYSNKDVVNSREVIIGIVTPIDLLNFITHSQDDKHKSVSSSEESA